MGGRLRRPHRPWYLGHHFLTYYNGYVINQGSPAKSRRSKMATIRPALLTDIHAIMDIYNEAILTTTATFDTDLRSEKQQSTWLMSHDERHPVIVAELDGAVVGWACLSKWSERGAYSDAAECTFYVKKEFRGKGIGRKLKAAVVAEGKNPGFHTLIARVAEGSDASIHLNESFGFRHVGVLKEVGRKFGRLLDVHIYQKVYDSATNS